MTFEKRGNAYVATIDRPDDVAAIDQNPGNGRDILLAALAALRDQVSRHRGEAIGRQYVVASPEQKAQIDAILSPVIPAPVVEETETP